MSASTPMMKQYKKIKQEHSDSVLFFRLGDFYEMFETDAEEVSSILNITLTLRNKIKMCGIPYHSAHTYIPRLLNAGKKVAICEQISLPKDGKGIAERKVVEIITPGTVVDEDFLDKNSNNYMLSIGKYNEFISYSYIDLSTGEFYISSFLWSERAEKLKKEIFRLQPSEILIQESIIEEDEVIRKIILDIPEIMLNRYPEWSFDIDDSLNRLKKQFNVINIKGFGFDESNPALFSCGILLEYLEETSKGLLPHIRDVQLYNEQEFIGLDESTRKNLEITKNLQDGSRFYTLLDVLDYTKTSPGSRNIRKWLLNPLNNIKEIIHRQKKVEKLYKNQILLSSLREILKGILDLERLSARVALDKAHAKDLIAIRNSLTAYLNIEDLLKEWKTELFRDDPVIRTTILEIKNLLDASIAEEPSIILTDGNMIKAGYDSDLDLLKNIKTDSKAVLQKYLDTEKEISKIGSLKIKYNKIIGNYIEVTKSYLHLVPEHFIRRQSLVGGERFTTERLAEIEIEINNSTEKIIELEKKLFLEIRERIKQNVSILLEIAGYIAELDCLQSFAQAATINGYTKPVIKPSKKIKIIEGRHPVVEANIPPGEFVPNTIDIATGDTSFALITGPNMAGKSTYLRQTALIVLMAQAGSYVPAEDAVIGMVDKIFCRVGASDNLARGESTFLVEMNETANILRSASDKSLIIMDEVGRGTSTNDGLSIAWAVSEFLLRLGARTLFATHYHELTFLESPNLRNLSMAVLEKKGEIVFLKKVKEGAAGNSYGIHVAGLAGLPSSVIKRANEILDNFGIEEKKKIETVNINVENDNKEQNLFSPVDLVNNEIRSINLNSITPIDALNRIAEWQKDLLSEKK